MRECGIRRILDDRQPTRLFDCMKTGRPIVHETAQHYTDDANAIVLGSRPKERIDRWPMQVLPWPAPHTDPADLHVGLHAGRSSVNSTAPNRLTVNGMSRGNLTSAIQNGRQMAGSVRPSMEHDKDGRAKIL